MTPKKTQPNISRCPRCGTPLQEAAYHWNPARGDFDVFVSCPRCTEVPGPAPTPKRPAAPATHAKPRK